MEIGHVMYRASRVQKTEDIILLYGEEPLKNTLELEEILGMNLCYSVFDGGQTVPFCFVNGKRAYVLNRRPESMYNPFFNFPSIFRGEFIVKDKIPKLPKISSLNNLISTYIDELGLGGKLIGPDKEITIPKFKTMNELKMKMEILGYV